MKEVCHALVGKPFSVVVLAGGKSQRMGRDKATLAWEQSNILTSVVKRLLPLSDDVLVVSNIPRDLPAAARQVADIIPGKGPLSGIHAGLTYARHELVFFTACDVPFLVPEIVWQLVAAVGTGDGSVVVYKEKLEPLFSCYRKQCAALIPELLAAEQYRIRALLAKINWVPVHELDGLDERCFMNINTGKEYEQAQEFVQD